jgi:hypothetical protein
MTWKIVGSAGGSGIARVGMSARRSRFCQRISKVPMLVWPSREVAASQPRTTRAR